MLTVNLPNQKSEKPNLTLKTKNKKVTQFQLILQLQSVHTYITYKDDPATAIFLIPDKLRNTCN